MSVFSPSRVRLATSDAEILDDVLDIIGPENVTIALPLNEASGDAADYLNPDIKFDVTGASYGAAGIIGDAVSLDGVNDYLSHQPVTSTSGGDNISTLTAGTHKAAQSLDAVAASVGLVRVRLRRYGTLTGVTAIAKFYSDNSGEPNSAVWSSDEVDVSAVTTSSGGQWVGFPFSTSAELQKAVQYWLVIEYVTSTGVDSSNYIAVYQNNAGSYDGGNRATFDGSAWTTSTGPLNLEVYTDDLNHFDEDWSVILCAYNVNEVDVYRYVFGVGNATTTAFGLSFAQQGRLEFLARQNGTNVFARGYTWPQDRHAIIAVTFNKAASTGKVRLYVDGRQVGSGDGTAGAAVETPTQPFTLGAYRRPDGTTGLYWGGRLGPVIVTSNTLTPNQVGSIARALRTFENT